MNDYEKNQRNNWNRAFGKFLKQVAVQNGTLPVHLNFITDFNQRI